MISPERIVWIVIFSAGLILGWWWRGVLDGGQARAMADGRGSAGKIMKQLIHEVEKDPSIQVDPIQIRVRLRQLQDLGREGSMEIERFLATGVDVMLGTGFGCSDGRLTQFPTLRVALLDALYDLGDDTALKANRDVLKQTRSGFEALLAARNLEHHQPGVHRELALQCVREIMEQRVHGAVIPENSTWMMEMQMLEIPSHYQDEKIIPTIERFLGNNPDMTLSWLMELGKYPPHVQGESLERLGKNGKLKKTLIHHFMTLVGMGFEDPGVRKAVVGVYRNLSSSQKETLLQSLGHMGGLDPLPGLMDPDGKKVVSSAAQKARIQGGLSFLDDVGSLSGDARAKKAIQEARRSLQTRLKSLGAWNRLRFHDFRLPENQWQFGSHVWDDHLKGIGA